MQIANQGERIKLQKANEITNFFFLLLCCPPSHLSAASQRASDQGFVLQTCTQSNLLNVFSAARQLVDKSQRTYPTSRDVKCSHAALFPESEGPAQVHAPDVQDATVTATG